MNESLIKSAKQQLNRIETLIVNGDHSNETTMVYFSALAKYYYYGGKADLNNRITNSGILNTLPTDKARHNYIETARRYTFGGQLKIRVHRGFVNCKADILGAGPEQIEIVVNKVKKFLSKYAVDMVYDKHTNVLTTIYNMSKNKISNKLNNWNDCDELENVICNQIVYTIDSNYRGLEDKYYNMFSS